MPPGVTAGLAAHVPPPGVAISNCCAEVLHTGPGKVKDGVNGLLIVTVKALVVGQFSATGVAVKLKIMVPNVVVGDRERGPILVLDAAGFKTPAVKPGVQL